MRAHSNRRKAGMYAGMHVSRPTSRMQMYACDLHFAKCKCLREASPKRVSMPTSAPKKGTRRTQDGYTWIHMYTHAYTLAGVECRPGTQKVREGRPFLANCVPGSKVCDTPNSGDANHSPAIRKGALPKLKFREHKWSTKAETQKDTNCARDRPASSTRGLKAAEECKPAGHTSSSQTCVLSVVPPKQAFGEHSLYT